MTEPQPVVDALLAAGVVAVAGGNAQYKRFAWPDGRRGSLVVPLDPAAPEYEELMGAVVAALERTMLDGQAAEQVLRNIKPVRYGQDVRPQSGSSATSGHSATAPALG